jgi:predicted porin
MKTAGVNTCSPPTISLSKQTDLYVLLNYEHVHGENVRATLFTATPSSGANQTIVSLGIRHRF